MTSPRDAARARLAYAWLAGQDTAPHRAAIARLESNARAAEERRATDAMATQEQRARSEEHTSELQSLMRNSYADFCSKKKKPRPINNATYITNKKPHTIIYKRQDRKTNRKQNTITY